MSPVADPELRELAREHLSNRKICRNCYARNSIRANKCRRCRSTDLRAPRRES
ncbi:MAG: 50S ribosomal protein L40e [Candidatus Kariarchaeaceae archaeon]|nr:50S ribosomal protein L40e [Candidatus Heimdallarchaeota archaeon]MCK5048464.1 50S ribosomal protein L40e [Candidatus Heimdallarchaeota archaeon]